MNDFHPELRLGRFIPRLTLGPVLTRLARLGENRPRRIPKRTDLRIEDVSFDGPNGPVTARVYRPTALTAPAPALYWMHGGGFLIGRPEQDEASSIAFALELGIVVVAVRYRLAPEHPAPAAVEDAYAGLAWLDAHAKHLGVDSNRVAVGGMSAGGGLAATLAIYAHDRGDLRPAFQLLVYPMLDDRTATRTDLDTRNVRVWTPESNVRGWTAYLGRAPGGLDVSPYAAAARREDLRGLPPAWIGVGTLDLFHEEDLAYAKRLEACGVACELHEVPGAFHGFDVLFRKTAVARAFWRAQADALRRALFV